MNLTIESIPLSLWGVNLRDKLGPVTWARVRSDCYARAGHVCEICGDVGPKHPVECHEIWEYDGERRIQKLVGFIALCPACHEVKHYGRACAVGRAAQAQRHFLKSTAAPRRKCARISRAQRRSGSRDHVPSGRKTWPGFRRRPVTSSAGEFGVRYELKLSSDGLTRCRSLSRLPFSALFAFWAIRLANRR